MIRSDGSHDSAMTYLTPPSCLYRAHLRCDRGRGAINPLQLQRRVPHGSSAILVVNMRKLTVVWWWWWWAASSTGNVILALGQQCGVPPCKSGCYLNTNNCVLVPEGFFSPTNANELYQCEAGTFSKMGYGFCLPCPPGAHTRDNASSTCHPCPQASYTPEPGFAECLQCNAALYSGWGSDRVVAYGGQEFCQRPGSTNQILTLTPTLSPTGSPLVSMEPTMGLSSSPSRSPRPTNLLPDKNQTSEEPTIQPSQQATPKSRVPSLDENEPTLSPSSSRSPSQSPRPTTTTTTNTPTTPPASETPTIADHSKAPTDSPKTVETSSNQFRKIFFRVLPVFLAALMVTIIACCIRSYKKRGPKQVRVVSQQPRAAAAKAASSPSGEECSSMGDVYLDDEEYDDAFVSVELGSSSAASSEKS